MNLYDKPRGVQTRWASFENPTAGRSAGGRANRSAKGAAYQPLEAGQTRVLLDFAGSGTVTRIWMTISDRSAAMLRSLRLEMFWDGADRPAVSAPLGDFFGVGLGRTVAFESGLLASPEGRSFLCLIPMPFRRSARVTLTNESAERVRCLFYEIDLLAGVEHSADALYLHSHWRRASPNALGQEFVILPPAPGPGRFLGCNVAVMADPIYDGAWWGEGEVKVRFGGEAVPTLCGTGAEDYTGTSWGLGAFAHRTCGCPIADRSGGLWAFYRYHLDDPVFFDDGASVAIQTIGGAYRDKAIAIAARGAAMIPVSLAPRDGGPFVGLLEQPRPTGPNDLASLPDGWINFWRQDDWSATAYLYLATPGGVLPELAPVRQRTAGLVEPAAAAARADT